MKQNKKITDLKDDYIASTITQDDLTKVSRQLNVSMGEMFYLVEGFAIVMFVMLIYLLTKMIIENNKVSISMVKILGYTSKEIQKMYVHATTIVIIISTLLSFGITTWILSYAFKIVFEKYAGDSREVKRYLNCKFDFYKDFVVKAQEMKNKS